MSEILPTIWQFVAKCQDCSILVNYFGMIIIGILGKIFDENTLFFKKNINV
jgi:hypothetical protein